MIVNLNTQIETIKGKCGDYYFRRLNGQLIMQHNPVKKSVKQTEYRKQFGLMFGTNRKKL